MIGPNGAGKSTVVNAISGNVQASAGQILLTGQPIHKKSPQTISKSGVARTFQTANLFDTLTVGENLLLARCKGKLPSMFKRTNTVQVPDSVFRILKLSGLHEKLSTQANVLGHGERKWLELLMVLCMDPNMVLLDEPTAGLTSTERDRKLVGY